MRDMSTLVEFPTSYSPSKLNSHAQQDSRTDIHLPTMQGISEIKVYKSNLREGHSSNGDPESKMGPSAIFSLTDYNQ
jgi:hypothetical protein